jgi:POT family proton-dependent oligopeptide transporter
LRRDWVVLGAAVAMLAVVAFLLVSGIIGVNPAPLASRRLSVMVGMAAAYFFYLFFGAGLDPVERKRVVVVPVMFVACALFWSGFDQAGSSLNLSPSGVDRFVGGFEIPAGWFQSVQPAL